MSAQDKGADDHQHDMIVPMDGGDAERPFLTALAEYQQADHDGVMVLASRQAIHETLELVDSLQAKLAEVERERDELRKVLEPFAAAAAAMDESGREDDEQVYAVIRSHTPNTFVSVANFRTARAALSATGEEWE